LLCQADNLGWVSYTDAEARQQLLDTLAEASDGLGLAIGYLGAAYEQLDEQAADRLEQELFRPVQHAYGRAKRVHAAFAERYGLPARSFAAREPQVRAHTAKAILESAMEAILRAESTLATLQDSMLPVDVGDPELRAGLTEVRQLLGGVRARARELLRSIGR
jgi:hypothetical protein